MQKSTEVQALATAGAEGGLEKALLSYNDLLYQELSKNRFAEEREWYEEGLFYQRRQWLKWDNSNKRWSVIKQDPDKPRPMPVSNHFARTINANANQLGAGEERVLCIPNDDADDNRRAAEFNEHAIAAIEEESGFRILRPLLAKHATLWGMGVAWDTFDTSSSNGVEAYPDFEVATSNKLGCMDCGNVADLGSGADMENGGTAAPEAPPQQAFPCPGCGSNQTVGWQDAQPVQVQRRQFSRGRISTEIRPIFEIYIPRDCQNPNLAKKLVRRYRKPLSEVKRFWPEQGDELQADEKSEIHEVYLEALRSLVNYNYMHDQTGEGITITEAWVDWDQLPDDLQEMFEEALETGELEPPDEELDPQEQLEQWGVFMISGGGKLLDFGINPNEGKKPPTFFLWEVDPANAYPKGLGSDLIPLQKRLNRIDSLIELAMMSNAAGKWLWPSTQTTQPPNGSPSDVIEYDPIGDGKIAPSFVQPSPFHGSVWQLRAAIKQDFLEIGLTEGIQMGSNPQGVTAFRGLAYLGAKAAEQINTQRALWEMGLKLRHEKTLIMARRNWTEGRRVKVAGYNGRYGMTQIFGDQMKGQFTVAIVENSSRPKTLEEKEQQLALLLQAGLVDITDPATREYVTDQLNLNNLNLVNHLQYLKAERDLDSVIAGKMPELTPHIDPQIFLQVFANFTLTEEFELLQPDAQNRVLMACQMISQALEMKQAAAAAQMMAAGAGPGAAKENPGKKLGSAIAGKHQGGQNPLDGIPGKTVSPDNAANAAEAEGQSIAGQMP